MATTIRGRWSKTFLKCVLMLLSVFGLSQAIYVGYDSANQQYPACLPIKRKHFPFRHWRWSGEFPVEGHFLQDPHFSCSDAVPVPSLVQSLLNDSRALFQIIDVNPFFEKNLLSGKEIVLVIQSKGRLFEYKLDYLHDPNGRFAIEAVSILAVTEVPMYPAARMFPFEGNIAVLANFNSIIQGYYIVPVPLKPSQTLQLHRVDKALTECFANLPDSEDLRAHFCDAPDKRFIAFYRKYRGERPAELEPREYTEPFSFEQFWNRPQ
jgi:hypothetical protein